MDEINVIGTSNLCAAAGAPGSTVRTVVVKSSTIVYGASRQDPAFFAESTPRSHPPRTRLERSLAEVEHYVDDFALDHPETAVSILRYCNVVGPDMTGSLAGLLARPFVPSIQGFDPLLQVVHEDDVVRSLRFAMDQGLRGTFNVAGDGSLPWSEVVAIAGRRRWPLPAVATEEVARGLRLAGVVKISSELLGLLRYGRGVDNSALEAGRLRVPLRHRGRGGRARQRHPAAANARSGLVVTAAAARTSRSSCAAPPPSCASRRSRAERRSPLRTHQGHGHREAGRRAHRGDRAARLDRGLRFADDIGTEPRPRRLQRVDGDGDAEEPSRTARRIGLGRADHLQDHLAHAEEGLAHRPAVGLAVAGPLQRQAEGPLDRRRRCDRGRAWSPRRGR